MEITKQIKNKIIALIDKKANQLGSYAAVAIFCGISESVLSQIRKDEYNVKGNDAWITIAVALEFDADDKWVVVRTTLDYKKMNAIINDARRQSMFIGVSDVGGSGKSAPLKDIYKNDTTGAIFYISCKEWSKREFLYKIIQMFGIAVSAGYKSLDELTEIIFAYLKKKVRQKKLIILLDEVDKLKQSALRFLIPLYNEFEDQLAVLIAGTENLEKEFTKGVQRCVKGYDELSSRFGRVFLHLNGTNKNEARAICEANGIKDKTIINEYIIDKLQWVKRAMGGEDVQVTKDLRRLKRLIIAQQLKLA